MIVLDPPDLTLNGADLPRIPEPRSNGIDGKSARPPSPARKDLEAAAIEAESIQQPFLRFV